MRWERRRGRGCGKAEPARRNRTRTRTRLLTLEPEYEYHYEYEPDTRNPPPLRETFPPMNALLAPKPNRRKRLALRFALLIVAVSALGAAYSFTRPPELVWVKSNHIGASGRHVRILVPHGGELKLPV